MVRSVGGLRPLHFFVAAEQRDVFDWFVQQLRRRAERLDLQILFRHAECNDVERPVLGREADILAGERLAFAFVEIARPSAGGPSEAGPSPNTFHGRVPKMHSLFTSIQSAMPCNTTSSLSSIVPSPRTGMFSSKLPFLLTMSAQHPDDGLRALVTVADHRAPGCNASCRCRCPSATAAARSGWRRRARCPRRCTCALRR